MQEPNSRIPKILNCIKLKAFEKLKNDNKNGNPMGYKYGPTFP
jgi:hypothetical protein